VTDLEVRRATLEDTYITLVQKFEGGQNAEGLTAFEEVSE
jgi:hypothetical protein